MIERKRNERKKKRRHKKERKKTKKKAIQKEIYRQYNEKEINGSLRVLLKYVNHYLGQDNHCMRHENQFWLYSVMQLIKINLGAWPWPGLLMLQLNSQHLPIGQFVKSSANRGDKVIQHLMQLEQWALAGSTSFRLESRGAGQGQSGVGRGRACSLADQLTTLQRFMVSASKVSNFPSWPADSRRSVRGPDMDGYYMIRRGGAGTQGEGGRKRGAAWRQTTSLCGRCCCQPCNILIEI